MDSYFFIIVFFSIFSGHLASEDTGHHLSSGRKVGELILQPSANHSSTLQKESLSSSNLRYSSFQNEQGNSTAPLRRGVSRPNRHGARRSGTSLHELLKQSNSSASSSHNSLSTEERTGKRIDDVFQNNLNTFAETDKNKQNNTTNSNSFATENPKNQVTTTERLTDVFPNDALARPEKKQVSDDAIQDDYYYYYDDYSESLQQNLSKSSDAILSAENISYYDYSPEYYDDLLYQYYDEYLELYNKTGNSTIDDLQNLEIIGSEDNAKSLVSKSMNADNDNLKEVVTLEPNHIFTKSSISKINDDIQLTTLGAFYYENTELPLLTDQWESKKDIEEIEDITVTENDNYITTDKPQGHFFKEMSHLKERNIKDTNVIDVTSAHTLVFMEDRKKLMLPTTTEESKDSSDTITLSEFTEVQISKDSDEHFKQFTESTTTELVDSIKKNMKLENKHNEFIDVKPKTLWRTVHDISSSTNVGSFSHIIHNNDETKTDDIDDIVLTTLKETNDNLNFLSTISPQVFEEPLDELITTVEPDQQKLNSNDDIINEEHNYTTATDKDILPSSPEVTISPKIKVTDATSIIIKSDGVIPKVSFESVSFRPRNLQLNLAKLTNRKPPQNVSRNVLHQNMNNNKSFFNKFSKFFTSNITPNAEILNETTATVLGVTVGTKATDLKADLPAENSLQTRKKLFQRLHQLRQSRRLQSPEANRNTTILRVKTLLASPQSSNAEQKLKPSIPSPIQLRIGTNDKTLITLANRQARLRSIISKKNEKNQFLLQDDDHTVSLGEKVKLRVLGDPTNRKPISFRDRIEIFKKNNKFTPSSRFSHLFKTTTVSSLASTLPENSSSLSTLSTNEDSGTIMQNVTILPKTNTNMPSLHILQQLTPSYDSSSNLLITTSSTIFDQPLEDNALSNLNINNLLLASNKTNTDLNEIKVESSTIFSPFITSKGKFKPSSNEESNKRKESSSMSELHAKVSNKTNSDSSNLATLLKENKFITDSYTLGGSSGHKRHEEIVDTYNEEIIFTTILPSTKASNKTIINIANEIKENEPELNSSKGFPISLSADAASKSPSSSMSRLQNMLKVLDATLVRPEFSAMSSFIDSNLPLFFDGLQQVDNSEFAFLEGKVRKTRSNDFHETWSLENLNDDNVYDLHVAHSTPLVSHMILDFLHPPPPLPTLETEGMKTSAQVSLTNESVSIIAEPTVAINSEQKQNKEYITSPSTNAELIDSDAAPYMPEESVNTFKDILNQQSNDMTEDFKETTDTYVISDITTSNEIYKFENDIVHNNFLKNEDIHITTPLTITESANSVIMQNGSLKEVRKPTIKDSVLQMEMNEDVLPSLTIGTDTNKEIVTIKYDNNSNNENSSAMEEKNLDNKSVSQKSTFLHPVIEQHNISNINNTKRFATNLSLPNSGSNINKLLNMTKQLNLSNHTVSNKKNNFSGNIIESSTQNEEGIRFGLDSLGTFFKINTFLNTELNDENADIRNSSLDSKTPTVSLNNSNMEVTTNTLKEKNIEVFKMESTNKPVFTNNNTDMPTSAFSSNKSLELLLSNEGTTDKSNLNEIGNTENLKEFPKADNGELPLNNKALLEKNSINDSEGQNSFENNKVFFKSRKDIRQRGSPFIRRVNSAVKLSQILSKTPSHLPTSVQDPQNKIDIVIQKPLSTKLQVHSRISDTTTRANLLTEHPIEHTSQVNVNSFVYTTTLESMGLIKLNAEAANIKESIPQIVVTTPMTENDNSGKQQTFHVKPEIYDLTSAEIPISTEGLQTEIPIEIFFSPLLEVPSIELRKINKTKDINEKSKNSFENSFPQPRPRSRSKVLRLKSRSKMPGRSTLFQMRSKSIARLPEEKKIDNKTIILSQEGQQALQIPIPLIKNFPALQEVINLPLQMTEPFFITPREKNKNKIQITLDPKQNTLNNHFARNFENDFGIPLFEITKSSSSITNKKDSNKKLNITASSPSTPFSELINNRNLEILKDKNVQITSTESSLSSIIPQTAMITDSAILSTPQFDAVTSENNFDQINFESSNISSNMNSPRLQSAMSSLEQTNDNGMQNNEFAGHLTDEHFDTTEMESVNIEFIHNQSHIPLANATESTISTSSAFHSNNFIMLNNDNKIQNLHKGFSNNIHFMSSILKPAVSMIGAPVINMSQNFRSFGTVDKPRQAMLRPAHSVKEEFAFSNTNNNENNDILRSSAVSLLKPLDLVPGITSATIHINEEDLSTEINASSRSIGFENVDAVMPENKVLVDNSFTTRLSSDLFTTSMPTTTQIDIMMIESQLDDVNIMPVELHEKTVHGNPHMKFMNVVPMPLQEKTTLTKSNSRSANVIPSHVTQHLSVKNLLPKMTHISSFDKSTPFVPRTVVMALLLPSAGTSSSVSALPNSPFSFSGHGLQVLGLLIPKQSNFVTPVSHANHDLKIHHKTIKENIVDLQFNKDIENNSAVFPISVPNLSDQVLSNTFINRHKITFPNSILNNDNTREPSDVNFLSPELTNPSTASSFHIHSSEPDMEGTLITKVPPAPPSTLATFTEFSAKNRGTKKFTDFSNPFLKLSPIQRPKEIQPSLLAPVNIPTSTTQRISEQGFPEQDPDGDGIVGISGVHYPAYVFMPHTGFTCLHSDQPPSNIFADISTNCQVYHVCHGRQKFSFLCPVGTIFNQDTSVCQWWFEVTCRTNRT